MERLQKKIKSISRFRVKIIVKETFTENDLAAADFVIGATSDPEVNTAIYKACIRREIPVNIVDDADKCTFVMPAIIKRKDL